MEEVRQFAYLVNIRSKRAILVCLQFTQIVEGVWVDMNALLFFTQNIHYSHATIVVKFFHMMYGALK